ncbi:MAG: hypothetical protein L3J37_06905 [Rhodobacteraceae bacterium]|nr:hypothetical protein [Paracoccaceae bacterium]
MRPKIIRVIAQLPPKGSVAARHAGEVVFHLMKAGFDVRPATTTAPAYSSDILPFAPKRDFDPMLARLLAEGSETLVLYPEGLDFREISQKLWRHRRLEEWRRIQLVWRLLRRAKRGIVVYRLKLLKRPGHLAIVMVALLLKLIWRRPIVLVRQSGSPAALAASLTGKLGPAARPEDVDLASLSLAARQGATASLCLTPLWLRHALERLKKDDPLREGVALILAVVEAYGEADLPAFQQSAPPICEAPFADRAVAPTHGVPLSAFMLHLHAARRLAERFPLDSRYGALAYLAWYEAQAADMLQQALPMIVPPAPLNAELTAPSLAQALRRLVGMMRFFDVPTFIDPALCNWLATPLTPAPNALTRLELLVAVLAHMPVSRVEALAWPWESEELKQGVGDLALRGYPLLLALIGKGCPPVSPPAIRVTGGAETTTGLGQNRQMSTTALAGIHPARDIYLHHVNADAIPAQMFRHHRPGSFHIGYLLWELENLPQAHRLAGEVLDEIWVPSRYLQKIYAREYDRPVTWVGKGFDLPPPEVFDLGKLGISAGQPVFLVSFDLHSSVARKNPLAAVLAFQMAFVNRPEARLILKTSPPIKNHWGDPEKQMQIISKIIAKDPRIILLQAHLPFPRYLGLISAVTALVSSHRAEGFGYLPAYAMKLGTPVIVTDYSGTQDFCTPDTAFCVPWRWRNVRPGEAIFPLKGARWAEIDHEALAVAMAEVAASPEIASQRCKAGKALMEQHYSGKALRLRYQTRLAELGLVSA